MTLISRFHIAAGVIDATQWTNDSDAEDETLSRNRAECREGVYIRVVGHIKPVEGKRTIVAFSVSPVTDTNEITYHLLAVLTNHARLTGKTGGAAVWLIPSPCFAHNVTLMWYSAWPWALAITGSALRLLL